ncbi:MAG: 4-alpha-glucanotransferase [Propionibacteriaceae bacterium]|nr:4-alpha-glucanotransferase [Propionibacteriaceae bacterium]
MSDLDARLADLAGRFGIATEFWDWKGEHRRPAASSIIACLQAMSVPVDGDDWIDQAFVMADQRPWRSAIPACVVVEQGESRRIDVHVPAGRPAHVWLRLEDGSTNDLVQVDNHDPDQLIDGQWLGRASFDLPTNLPVGYHALMLNSDDAYWQGQLIVTPTFIGLPMLGIDSAWGYMAQLYSVCADSSWGVGDFWDLADLASWARIDQGADFVLINPVHAAEVVAPMTSSPYFPATRRYLNPIYIRPEMVEEFASASREVQAKVRAARKQAMAATKASAQVERDAVWSKKMSALRLLFQVKRRLPRQLSFERFVAEQGPSLRHYAVWCALSEIHGNNWHLWPADLQHPDGPAVAQFETEHSVDVSFFMWLQWVADDQASHAQASAKANGMRVGVISDLAVGVNRDGEETWALQDVFAAGVTVGAPPDAYNQFGQDWLQPPWRPDRLEASGYAAFRDMVRAILRYSGAIRVDHIIGLFRLWWVPNGSDASQGVYVRYNHEAMIGILALEAQRAGAAVIGEDLGTVEPWVRQYLERRGFLGTSVLWFENDAQGQPLPPDHWRRLCLASVTTHDLPPTLGYLAHDHVALRHRLGLLTEPLEEEIARDAHEQEAVLAMLEQRGLIAPGERDPHEVMLGLYRFLYQTPSQLRCVALVDAVGERRTQNQPGTIDEYPNWRVPLGDAAAGRISLERVYALDSVERLAAQLDPTP